MRFEFVWQGRWSYVLIEWGYTLATRCRCGCPMIYGRSLCVGIGWTHSWDIAETR